MRWIKIWQVQIVANICIIIKGINEFPFVKRKFMESIIGITGGLYIPSCSKPFSPLKLKSLKKFMAGFIHEPESAEAAILILSPIVINKSVLNTIQIP